MELFELRTRAALIVVTLAVLIGSYVLAKQSRVATLLLLAAGLGLVAVLVLPAAPRVARALQQLAYAAPPTGQSGPYPVASFNVRLAPKTGDGAPIAAQVWYPSAAPPAPGAPLLGCAQATSDRHLSEAEQRFHIVLYAPGFSGGRDDNASTSAMLASNGYVVIAIDDIDHDPPAAGGAQPREPFNLEFSSDEAYAKTLRGGARKAQLEAEKALAALDRFAACASADWRSRLDFDRAGIFGFSFGGAAAAEAGVIDNRIAAVANLDGWLFGRAAAGGLDKPYMVMNSDAPVPGQRQLQSADAGERNQAALTIADLREEVRLASRPDGYWIWVKGSRHEGYSDQIFDRRNAVSWMKLDPLRMKTIRDAYLLAFFDAHLRGRPAPLLRQTPAPFAEVELLKDSAPRLKEALAAPAQTQEAPPAP